MKGHTNNYEWDKDIRKLIHSHKTANRFYRDWAGHGTGDTEVLRDLWCEYLSRKQEAHAKIKIRNVDHKLKVIISNSQKGIKNTRFY